MSREDQYRISVFINNVDYGIWDKMSGGEVDSEESKYTPGNMGEQVALGGTKTVNNVTVSRLYDHTAVHDKMGTLLGLVGVAPVTVTKQPLDVNKNPFGKPLVYTGKLKQVTPPDVDSESSDAALVEIEVSSATVSQ